MNFYHNITYLILSETLLFQFHELIITLFIWYYFVHKVTVKKLILTAIYSELTIPFQFCFSLKIWEVNTFSTKWMLSTRLQEIITNIWNMRFESILCKWQKIQCLSKRFDWKWIIQIFDKQSETGWLWQSWCT